MTAVGCPPGLELLQAFAEAHGRALEVIEDMRRAKLVGDTERHAQAARQLLDTTAQRDSLFRLWRRTQPITPRAA